MNTVNSAGREWLDGNAWSDQLILTQNQFSKVIEVAAHHPHTATLLALETGVATCVTCSTVPRQTVHLHGFAGTTATISTAA